jgi:hypothetical protein
MSFFCDFCDTLFHFDAVHTIGLWLNSCLGIVEFVGTWFKVSSDILYIFLLWCLPTYNFLLFVLVHYD